MSSSICAHFLDILHKGSRYTVSFSSAYHTADMTLSLLVIIKAQQETEFVNCKFNTKYENALWFISVHVTVKYSGMQYTPGP